MGVHLGSVVKSILLGAALALLSGCGAKATVATGEKPGAAESIGTGESSAAAPVPGTADQAVRAVVTGVQNRRLRPLWDFLPQSYQDEVNGLVHDFARRMDRELWNETVKSLKKLVLALRAGSRFAPREETERLAGLIETLVESDLGSLDRLARADVGAIADTTGGRLLSELSLLSHLAANDPLTAQLAALGEMRVSLVESAGDTARVKIESEGQPPVTTEFVRIEGKWVPKALAEGWIEAMGQARARLAVLSPEALAELKPQWLKLLGTASAALEDAAAATDAGPYQAAMERAKFALAPLAGRISGALPNPEAVEEAETQAEPEPPAAAELMTLLVHGTLTDGELEATSNRLRELLPANHVIESTGDDSLTSFKIGPVEDPEQFARELDFLEITRVDPKTRTITAKLTAKARSGTAAAVNEK